MPHRNLAPVERAYSVLTIKSVDEDERVITGIATTPEPDRYGDIVEPLGVKFANPLPLLWQHKADQPVGTCEFKKPTEKGIEFVARIAKIADEGNLKARLDEAWQSVKAKLVRAVSIGFRPLEYSWMDEGGVRFIASEVLELSLVTIPANSDCTIQTIKSIDSRQRAASGLTQRGSAAPPPPGASGNPNQSAARRTQSNPKEKSVKKSIKEQIADYEAKRAANLARMNDLANLASEAQRGLDEKEDEEYLTLESENEQIDKHLPRLRSLETANVNAAKAAPATPAAPGDVQRGARPVIRTKEGLAPGIRFARYARCLLLAKRTSSDPEKVAQRLYPQDDVVLSLVAKAAVAAGSTASGNWAAALVGEETAVFADFVEFLRPMTIIGRFGIGNIPSLRKVPFRVPLIGQTSGGEGYWVGEGRAKPLTHFDFARRTLEPLKVANIAVVSMELLRDSSPSAEVLLRDQLAKAIASRMDKDFINPAKAPVVGVSPASITYGITPINASGTDEAAVRHDIKALWQQYIDANLSPSSAVYVMPSTIALGLSLMTNSLQQDSFPEISMNGGSLKKIPVITSEYVPRDSSGAIVALVNAEDIYFADDGEVSVDMSTEASLEMSDSPSGNSVTPTATTLVSLWQTNNVGFLAERTVNWARRRDESVQYLRGVRWGG